MPVIAVDDQNAGSMTNEALSPPSTSKNIKMKSGKSDMARRKISYLLSLGEGEGEALKSRGRNFSLDKQYGLTKWLRRTE